MLRDDQLPDELRQEIVANCCRGALDAAAITKVRRVRLERGQSHADVDATLQMTRETHNKVALAIFDEPNRASDLYSRLNREHGPWAIDVLKACKEGAHGADCGELSDLISNTKRLATRIQQ